ncbi:MAG: hypothetical protein JWO56_2841, partial [Acidobacteria bacterium]|nr:hypothetical protein [Acidobacteriota bacterium]
TRVRGGSVEGGATGLANFATPFTFVGDNSILRDFSGYVYAKFTGNTWSFSGVTQTGLASAETAYLGVNGRQTAPDPTLYCTPRPCRATAVNIALSAAPGVGKSITFTAYGNGAAIGSPLVVSGNASFGGSIALNTSAAMYDEFWIKAVADTGTVTTFVRYSMDFTG